MAPVLLLVDFQEEWRDRKSDYYLGQFKAQLHNAASLLEHFHKNNWPVIFTRHVEVGSTTAFAEGSKRAQITPELSAGLNDRVITKNKISPFYQTDLERMLKEVAADELVVGGIMTNLCVRSAVSDAYDRGYAIKVVTDTCVSDSAETNKFTFNDLKKTRPEVGFVKTKDLVKAK